MNDVKTPEEIKMSLELCSSGNPECRKICPYDGESQDLLCTEWAMRDALAYIEQLEERINLMLIQMRGDCGCCAYKGRPSYKSPCTECLCGENHPKWEYEGLPDVKEKGDME